jgi:acyl-CoA thioesterase I
VNPIVLLLADGDALFVGIVAALIPLIVRCWGGQRRVVQALARVIGVLGAVFVLASSTPLPYWIFAGWLVVWIAGFFVPISSLKRFVLPLFVLVSAGICLSEAPYHASPKIPVGKNQVIYVIGDSISAGVGSSERNWPLVLGDISGLRVVNLAMAGATAASALEQEDGIKDKSLVILEIGGNDMLGDTSAEKFEQDLDKLLSRVPSSCTCAMFELPLLPFHNKWGEIQRALAKKYKVILIPKKCMTDVIGGNGNTLDGLHLSQKGHDAFARGVFSMLAIQQ